MSVDLTCYDPECGEMALRGLEKWLWSSENPKQVPVKSVMTWLEARRKPEGTKFGSFIYMSTCLTPAKAVI